MRCSGKSAFCFISIWSRILVAFGAKNSTAGLRKPKAEAIFARLYNEGQEFRHGEDTLSTRKESPYTHVRSEISEVT